MPRVAKPFDYYVDKSGDCWNWIGCVVGGYGRHLRDRAHRTAYRMAYGEIPSGMVVMHKCDNPRCVKPEHLTVGTLADNNKDRAQKRRSATGERAGRSKLLWIDIERIREAHRCGASARQLSMAWWVGRTTINSIVANKAWRT